MDINAIIEGFGFPISCVLALGWYINKKDAEAKEDRIRERENDKAEKERLVTELVTSREANRQVLEANKIISDTNREVSETNKLLAKDLSEKLDLVIVKVDTALRG